MNSRPPLPNTLEECHQVIREFHQLVFHLMERVEKLEQENRDLRARLDANSNNSSKPPSSDFKKNKPAKKPSSGKPSGGQKGHPGYYRELVDSTQVNRIVDCEAFKPCHFCGCAVEASGGPMMRHQVYELPPIHLDITEYRIATGQCEGCHRKQLASLPEGVSFGITGPKLTSFMSILVTKYQLSRRALKEFLAEHFNFQISLGTVFNKEKIVNRVLKEPVDALLPIVKQSISANMDETGHRESGQNYWVWTVASKTAAYFKITKSRGKKVIDELMADFEGIVISDRHAAYHYFDSEQRQMCWSHLKRDFTKLWQKDDKVISRIGKGLLARECELFQVWHRFKKGEITRDELQLKARPITKAVGEYLEQGSYTAPELKAARFCKNLLENFSSLWVFLNKEGVEPTNNHAERCLRGLVIWRKKYFGTQSSVGSEYLARAASLNTTARLQGISPFKYLTAAINAYFSQGQIPLIIDNP